MNASQIPVSSPMEVFNLEAGRRRNGKENANREEGGRE